MRDGQQKAACVVQGGLTAALIIFTVLFHILLVVGYRPLLTNLPLNQGVELTEEDMENDLAKKKAFTGFKEDPLSAVMDTGVIVGSRAVKNVTSAAKQAGNKTAKTASKGAGMAGKKVYVSAKAAGSAVAGLAPPRPTNVHRSRSAESGCPLFSVGMNSSSYGSPWPIRYQKCLRRR